MRSSALLIPALLAMAAPAHAEQQTAAMPVTIRVFGGLLGQVEGFCEDPGGSYDWYDVEPLKGPSAQKPPLVPCGQEKTSRKSMWLGGALGVAEKIREAKSNPDDLLIVAGDNQAVAFGQAVWGYIAALKPHAVALGPEDFYRKLRRSTESARDLRDWIKSNAHIPLVASNVAIRRSKKDMNGVESEDGKFTLKTEEDSSVPWIASLQLEHPPLTSPEAWLEEFGARPLAPQSAARRQVGFAPGKETEPGTISFDPALRPGRWYRLTIKDGTLEKASFVFQTDVALTPITAAAPAITGFPAHVSSDQSWLIVSMIDPEAKAGAANSAWTWEESDGEYEVVFLDPKKTLAALLALLKDKKNNLPPAIILISSLSDPDTTDLLNEFPEIRFVVLHPESGLIARASRKGERGIGETGKDDLTRFSGDRGFAGVLDVQYPEATKVMVRPEWFGETLLTITAHRNKSSRNPRELAITEPDVTVDVVPGAELKYQVQTSNPEVSYSAVLGTNTVLTGQARSYQDCAVDARGECADFRAIWLSDVELVGVMGNALRERVGVDMSIVSKELIDPDYFAWVSRRLATENTNWISRYILERMVYASPRIVKVYVSGADLVSTLDKALKEDKQYCISGIGAACPSSVDTKHGRRLTINGRRVNPRLYYTIAVPDALAEKLSLQHSDDEETIDVVEAAHQHFQSGQWRVPHGNGTRPLTERLETRRSRRMQGYFVATTLDAGLTYIRPKDPDGGTGVRKNLGLGFSGAEETKTYSVSFDSDLGLIDAQSFAIRVPAAAQYTRRKEPDKITFDSDEFSTGVRFDWKYRMARPYFGYFVDGQINDHPNRLTASRKLTDSREGFQSTETAGFRTEFITDPRRFRHWGGGIEVLEIKELAVIPKVTLTLRKAGVKLTRGSESHVPIGMTIGGVEQSLDRMLSEGEGTLLNDYFTANPDTFSTDVVLDIKTRRLPQTRVQLESDGELKWTTPRKKEYTAGLKVRYRWYNSVGDAISPFQLASELKIEVSLGVPLWWRFKLVPAWVYERATIEAQTNDAFRFNKLDVKVSLPINIRYGHGRVVR